MKIISTQSENDHSNCAASGNGFKSRGVERSENLWGIIIWWAQSPLIEILSKLYSEFRKSEGGNHPLPPSSYGSD